MSHPLVSIIIPAFNHKEALETCLKSIEAQTYSNLEIIVVDDGSTDGTEVAFASQSSTHPYRFVRQENRGAPAARNAGAQMANGTFLIFVDADVTLQKDAIERMVMALEEHPDASFVYSSFRFGGKRFRVGPFDPSALRRGPLIHTTSLIRKDFFPGFDESLKKFQDWDLWLTIVEKGGTGIWIPEELFQVATRHDGMSSWLPSIVHRLPWPMFGWLPQEIARYREWESVIKKKHHITG